MHSYINKNYNTEMDPTKPILDLYGDSYYLPRQREVRQVRQVPQNYKTSSVATYNQNTSSKYNTANSNQNTRKVAQPAVSYADLQDKYQQLYQAYKDKSSKLSHYEGEFDGLRSQNARLRDEIDKLNGKNQQLNSTLLSKNMELEEAYRRLQDQMRGASRGTRTNNAAIDKLEDGLRQAITSNFQILRQSALAQLKQFIH